MKFYRAYKNTILDAAFALCVALFALKDVYTHFDRSHVVLSYLWFCLGYVGGIAVIYAIERFSSGEKARVRWMELGGLFLLVTGMYGVIGWVMPR